MTKSAQFPTTRWTLVLASGDEGSRREALDWLCRHYWQPLYVFLRRLGHDPASAQDLTQGFLAVFLQRRSMEGADPERGRFRSYLLGALRNYLADRRDHEGAAMRGGDTAFVPLSMDRVEESYLKTPANLSPESLYEREWALALIGRVLRLMRDEQESAGKVAVFDVLKDFLTADGDYSSAAKAVGISEGAARVAVHRLRRRYRELLTAEIAETVRDSNAVQSEIRHLIAVISGS